MTTTTFADLAQWAQCHNSARRQVYMALAALKRLPPEKVKMARVLMNDALKVTDLAGEVMEPLVRETPAQGDGPHWEEV